MFVRRTAAAVLAAGLLLAGCSDDPEPVFEPTDSPSPTKSSSAAPEAQSPEEFIREWVATYNKFEQTGDGSELQLLSEGCGTCQDIIDVVSTAYERGGYLQSDGWALPAKIDTTYTRKTVVGLRARVQISASKYQAKDSSDVVRSPAATVVMEFDLEKRNGSWRMFDLTRIAT